MLNRYTIPGIRNRLNRLVFLFGLTCYCFTGHGQTDSLGTDSLFYFKARLADSISREPVQFAHIVNTKLGYATISDSLGYFYIRAAEGNMLQISAIGYSILQIDLHDSILQLRGIPYIRCVPYVYSIGGVTVNPLGSYDQFRGRFLRHIPEEPEHRISTLILREIDLGLDTVRDMSPPSAGSPITHLYNLWSREGKERRKLAALFEEEKFLREIAHKYNPGIVSRVTGYKDMQLNEFMDFCNFNRKFLLQASDYQIVDAILVKKRAFEKLTGD